MQLKAWIEKIGWDEAWAKLISGEVVAGVTDRGRSREIDAYQLTALKNQVVEYSQPVPDTYWVDPDGTMDRSGVEWNTMEDQDPDAVDQAALEDLAGGEEEPLQEVELTLEDAIANSGTEQPDLQAPLQEEAEPPVVLTVEDPSGETAIITDAQKIEVTEELANEDTWADAVSEEFDAVGPQTAAADPDPDPDLAA